MIKILKSKEHGNILSSLNYFLKFNIPKSKKILDLGCNYGSLIFNLYKRGYKNVYGIDINKKSINVGKKQYKKIANRLKLYNGKTTPFKDKTFDVVLMFDVIEHIPNIAKFLKKEVYRILKEKGVFIFQTPNKLINIPWEIINNKSLTKWKQYHGSLQTLKSLRYLLKNANLKNIKIEKYNIDTKHNQTKIRKKIGLFGFFGLKILKHVPLIIYPNLWGKGEK
jgi:2-polyprenyl-3-methyl-5-hydroxy-6-metoxy-1,4-benzoquinol methylase